MIQDFEVEQDNQGQFDLTINEETKDFGSVAGMETTIDFQLFVDQRVSKEDRVDPLNRRGWMGDIDTRDQNYSVGSLLHLQEQSRDTLLDNRETAAYAENALGYLIAIGASKEISARVVGKNIEGVIVNAADDVGRYSRLWKETQTDA